MKNWVIEKIRESDLMRLHDFFGRFRDSVGGYGSAASFLWKIFKNPSAQGFINFISSDSEIASTTSITPKTIWIRGKSHLCAEIGDTFTGSKFQRMGMFATLINRSREDAQRAGIEFVYGTPNFESLQGYEKKANFKVLKNFESMRYVLMINPLQKVFDNSSIITISQHFFASIYRVLFFLKGLFTKQDYSVLQGYALPGGWSVFWQKFRAQHDFVLDRSEQKMIWRFIENPEDYVFFSAVKKDSLVAFLVVRVFEQSGKTQLALADFGALDGEEGALRGLVLTAIRFGISKNVFQIYGWDTPGTKSAKILSKCFFVKRGKIPVIGYSNAFFDEIEGGCARIHFRLSDSDNV